ncbi:Lin1244/Lin1753 domain-containing protein [Bacteroides sp. 224]|uniref:DUF7833 domain-containing protein n=1 Tax=Bacteroides sp. 224 TaxID=2302936 RepID=UPI0013CF57E7|nr:Lin1244/Lin1753 domain-containing protein [Bacteroides sp. 224]
MGKKHYLPLKADITKDEKVVAIIEKHGLKGLGTYTVLLMELYQHPDYCCKLSTIRMALRAFKANKSLLDDLIRNQNLFELTEIDGENYLTSIYLNELEKKQKSYTKSKSAAGKKGAKIRWQKDSKRDGKSMAIYKEEEVVILNTEERKEKKSWQEYVTEAFSDRTWVECQAAHSGLEARFLKHETYIINLFLKHVLTHGTENKQLSLQDIKFYFANFIRQGTITCKRVTQKLNDLENKQEATTPYRFETIDEVTGERSYYGNIIPKDAPPRPNDRMVWNYGYERWE